MSIEKSNMADEDEVDVLGDFTFDNFFPKEDSRISACYDGGVLGAQGADQLLHDCINPAWLLEPSQPCWFSPSHDERHRTSPAEDRSALGFSSSLGSAGSPSHWEEGDSWTEREKNLLDKGIELFGRSWSRVAQFVGSKSPQQVRTQARLMGITGVSSVSESSEHQEDEETPAPPPPMEVVTKPATAFNLSELIDDMAIPASMEEVIAVVTTAQPTVPGLCTSPPQKRQRHQSNENRTRTGRGRGGKRGRPRKHTFTDYQGTTIHEDSDADLVMAIPSPVKEPVPIRVVSEGEELVRIQKENVESEDSEIEIDDMDDDPTPNHSQAVMYNNCTTPTLPEQHNHIKEEMMAVIKEEVLSDKEDEKVDTKTEMSERVFNLPVPTQEVTLDPDFISDEEKAIHHEFFLGRATKTPSRYLKIRNHIIECWLQNKPRYTSKTSVRTGLRNCGDVNCIGRIHAYLEMVGAINFGCEQTAYRPIVVPLTYARNFCGTSHINKSKQESKSYLPVLSRAECSRPRKKKTDFFDSDGEGGLTIIHDAEGGVVYTKVQHEPRKEPREKRSAHEQLRLVYCHKFTDAHPAPYCVVLDVGALLLMDVHAHSCRSEVIGLLGGSFDSNSSVLHITRGVACKSQSTGVQCDMCPVSQTEASEQLQSAGLEVVGWYHSHPTFLANPSLQDLDTQLKVQTWFDKTDAPFVGIIVSPYFQGNKTLASTFKCLIVREEQEERKPYQFPVMVSSSQTCSDSLVHRIADVFKHLDLGPGSEVVPFHENTNLHTPTTYLEKLVESVRLHIDQCQPPLSMDDRANLLTGIMDICEQHAPPKNS